MTHTPGPWKYVPHDTLNGGTIIAPSQSADGLSEIVVYGLCNPNLADMSLIAAAPELLEALKGALETAIFESHPKRPWHQAATEAIHKATGGE